MKNDFVLWARQYSKRLITFLLITWVIGAVIGIGYEFLRLFTAPDMASMDSLYIYLAVPLTCGIPAYLIPNAFMNVEKIKQKYIPDYDSTILGGGEYIDEDGIGPHEESDLIDVEKIKGDENQYGMETSAGV